MRTGSVHWHCALAARTGSARWLCTVAVSAHVVACIPVQSRHSMNIVFPCAETMSTVTRVTPHVVLMIM